jgi:integrase
VVVEVEGGITVYPARRAGDRWRAVWYEGGRRRQCEAVAEDKLAAKLARVAERMQADAPNLERPGADLIAWYLCPDRHPAARPWSRRHADTQRRLCERFVAPVIAAICCQDIRLADMQQVVNAAPTAGEGARLRRCLSAMVTAGIAAGYLTSPRLKEVHWQAAGRPAPAPQVATAGESAQFVDPAEIPAGADVARLGRALARGRRGDLHELMANTAAYAGLRQGELFALTAGQVAAGARVITVDRKVVEVAGKLYLEAPKGRKRRSTIYPASTPGGYPLAGTIAARAEEARAEQAAGANPLGLMFPSPRGSYWRSSNFDRRVLAPAYQAAGWRGPGGAGTWTWHSLRHVFCTTALSCWHLEPADLSCMAGHATVRVTLDMYVGATAGVLDRARTATQ